MKSFIKNSMQADRQEVKYIDDISQKMKLEDKPVQNIEIYEKLEIPKFSQSEPTLSSGAAHTSVIIQVDDPIVFQLMREKNEELIEKIARQRQLGLRVRTDKNPPYFELFSQRRQQIPQKIIQEISQLLESIKLETLKDIVQIKLECNQEQQDFLVKALDDKIQNQVKIEFIDYDGSSDSNNAFSYEPEIIKEYLINGRIIVKLAQIERPALLNLRAFDLLVLNRDMNGVFFDDFGNELAQRPEVQALLQKLKEDRLNKLEGIFYDYVIDFKDQMTNFCFHNYSKAEEYVSDLIQIVNLVESQELKNPGFMTLGLPIPEQNSQMFIKEFFRILNSKNGQEDSYLAFPSEIYLIVKGSQVEEVTSFIEACRVNKFIDPQNLNKGGEWSCQVPQYGGGQGLFGPFGGALNTKKVSLPEEVSVIIQKFFLKQKKEVLILLDQQVLAPPALPPGMGYAGYFPFGAPIQQPASRKIYGRQDDGEEQIVGKEYEEETQVNLLSLVQTLQRSGIERPIVEEQKGVLSYMDTVSESFVQYEPDMNKLLNEYTEIGIDKFNFQRSILDFRLISKVYIADLENMLIFSVHPKTYTKYQQVGTIVRQENEKFNYLNEQIDPEHKNKMIDIKQRVNELPDDKIVQEEEIKKKAQSPSIIVKGEKNAVEQVDKNFAFLLMKQHISHTIQLNERLGKENLKYVQEIGEQRNLKILYDDDQMKLMIRGFKKTINNAREDILQSTQIQFELFSYPADWVLPQEENCQLYEIDVRSQEVQDIQKRMRETLPNTEVVNVKRVQNLNIWKNFSFEKKKLEQKGDASEQLLFHGTRANDPKIIYAGIEDAFDFRLCQGGSFGRGTYFHDMASYSNNYAFHLPNGNVCFFLVRVLLGQCLASPPNGGLTAPPYIPGTQIRYDSVRSNQPLGRNQHIIYSNNKAYPYYLIEYKLKALGGGAAGGLFLGGFGMPAPAALPILPMYPAINRAPLYGEEEDEEDQDYDSENQNEY